MHGMNNIKNVTLQQSTASCSHRYSQFFLFNSLASLRMVFTLLPDGDPFKGVLFTTNLKLNFCTGLTR